MDPLRSLTLDQLRARTSLKWRAYAPDVLPLFVAEMDAQLADPVIDAVTQAVTTGDTGYPAGREGYVDALAGFADQRWGWTFDRSTTALVPDVMGGIVEVLRLTTDPGDTVIVNPPVYPPFYGFIAHADRRVEEAPLGPGDRLDLDVIDEAMGRAVAGGRRAAYLLCSPQNPTGVVHTADELAAVARLAAAHGVQVVVDEIHAPLVFSPARFVPYLSVPGGAAGIALHSASKGWNLAGVKAALAVAGPDAAADLARMPEVVWHGASHLGVTAHIAAFTAGGGWLDDLLTALAANVTLLSELLHRHLPEVRYRPNEATYLAWLDCRALHLGDDPAAVFLERGRVALVPGPDFGTGGAGHVRLNLATAPAILEEAALRMAEAIR
ncbi:MalY/PatB family protein [Nitriliruptor alkaliphilus]|uniref:MalY/PatB family protein n=1 Tax=Nitriliruptor alkaliphilus TaxID=427918 RepID=UPI00069896FA|nr:aminotransferase class I/II-fold pyridoxal phosphate-dependent enzyme [Nitriliruptor alkaliphilus]